MKPKRIQRKRTKGWRMPPNTVYVGRPSKWGNPYKTDRFSKRNAMNMYYQDLGMDLIRKPVETKNRLKELKGKNLACWCSLVVPCHADILLGIANKRIRKKRKEEK